VRFAYDTIYGIFFGILFGNIISGIMLDAFGSLREINTDLLYDKSNFCYICNISRESL
jgi:inositol 1,4,5-triphosphate receptor type 1/inositol 1,4,5-triphosphate receptor type 3